MIALASAMAVSVGLLNQLPGAGRPARPTDSYTSVPLLSRRSVPHMWVECEIDGRPVKLIVDTGAGDTCIVPALAKRLGVRLVPSGETRIGNAVATAYRAAEVRLKVGSVTRDAVRVGITDLSEIFGTFEKTAGVEVAGLLGVDFLRNHDAVVDFRSNRLYFRDAPSEEMAALQGEWRATLCIHHGDHVAGSEPLKSSRLTLTGRRFTLRLGDVERSGTWSCDPGVTPKRLSISQLKADGLSESLPYMIHYDLDGDRLRLLLRQSADAPLGLPDKLESTAENKLSLWTFVRVEVAPPPRPK